MQEIVTIEDTNLMVKTWKDQRVVTFKDIDEVHQRPEGTAKRNFNNNKKHFRPNEDYFVIPYSEFSTNFVPNPSRGGNPENEVYLFTESGYLMLVKSFTDDLAWDVQRELVNTYFKFQISEREWRDFLAKHNELFENQQKLIEISDNLECRIACIESGTSVSGGRISKWVKETSADVMELAKYCDCTVKEMYSRIIIRMEDMYGMFFQKYFDDYVANHPNEKPVWRIVVIEYYDLKDAFEDAYIKIGREVGLYTDKFDDICYDF